LVKNLEQSHAPEAAKAIAEFGEEAVKAERERREAVKPETIYLPIIILWGLTPFLSWM
jgi:hypothetical protein